MMLNIYTKFVKKYLKGFQSYLADRISILKFTKLQNTIKKIGGVRVFILCTSSNKTLYLYQVS